MLLVLHYTNVNPMDNQPIVLSFSPSYLLQNMSIPGLTNSQYFLLE